MGVFDTIGNALSGKVSPQPSGPSNTKTTQVTDADRAAVQARRNSPEFQAALRAQNAVSGVDTAMSKHADQVHPVPK